MGPTPSTHGLGHHTRTAQPRLCRLHHRRRLAPLACFALGASCWLRNACRRRAARPCLHSLHSPSIAAAGVPIPTALQSALLLQLRLPRLLALLRTGRRGRRLRDCSPFADALLRTGAALRRLCCPWRAPLLPGESLPGPLLLWKAVGGQGAERGYSSTHGRVTHPQAAPPAQVLAPRHRIFGGVSWRHGGTAALGCRCTLQASRPVAALNSPPFHSDGACCSCIARAAPGSLAGRLGSLGSDEQPSHVNRPPGRAAGLAASTQLSRLRTSTLRESASAPASAAR
jgi:hypothetical protein